MRCIENMARLSAWVQTNCRSPVQRRCRRFMEQEVLSISHSTSTISSLRTLPRFEAHFRYGCRPLFAVLDNASHASRKKLFSQMHSKSFMMSPPVEAMMKEKISLWVSSLGSGGEKDVWTDLRWIAIDLISTHLWGEKVAYKTLINEEDRQLMSDVLYPKNIYLPSWLIHFPKLSHYIENSIGALGINPMHTIREHAFEAFQKFKLIASKSGKISCVADKLWTQHVSNGGEIGRAHV